MKEDKLIAKTRNSPTPPWSIDIGSLFTTRAIRTNSVNTTAIGSKIIARETV